MKKRLKKKKSTLKIRPLLITIIALSGVAYFAISRLPRAVPIGINEVSVAPATVTLALPASVITTPGSESSADITINTGGAQVTAVQVELSYDPSKISTPTLVQGDFLSDQLGNPKIKDGLISFVYVVPLQSDGKSGSGKLATIRFQAKGDDSQLTFTKNTMVAATGTNSNVLASATGANITPSSPVTSTTPPTPPILTEIAPAPALATPVAPNPTPTNQAGPAQQDDSLATYLPENDYDYSQAGLDISVDDPSTPPSAFARFLARIKALFSRQP